MAAPSHRQRFSVDVAGLLEALTEQFPEPLLCVRELVQNAADAGAGRIEVDVAFDGHRGLMRLSVRDDGRGMNATEVEAYLTIGFSQKDPHHHRGRFGVGKLSPYALGISRMVVETCDGQGTHRIVFNRDGSGTIAQLEPRPRGTTVRVYKSCQREEAETIAEKAFDLVKETCGSLTIPLFVNGTQVNEDVALATPYLQRFDLGIGQGTLAICEDPVRRLMGGGIVLESETPILGPEVSYIIDSARLSPTLSRNAVRRDEAFDELLRLLQAKIPSFMGQVASVLRVRVRILRQEGDSVERRLDADDRAALDWLRTLLLEPEADAPQKVLKEAPVLETADGNLVSAQELIEILRREGRVPISRVPRTRDEISAYVDRGIPVLLLYRDLEDFLDRQSIETFEVDGQDDGIEISQVEWGKGELALAERKPIKTGERNYWPGTLFLFLVLAAGAVTYGFFQGRNSQQISPDSSTVTLSPTVGESPEIEAPVSEAPAAPETSTYYWLPVAASAFLGLSGTLLIFFALGGRKEQKANWLWNEAGAPLTRGEAKARRVNILSRALFHPVDFFVARGWSAKASGAKSLGAQAVIQGYREFAPEQTIRSGFRLDLDRITLGFVDLISRGGDPHDGRILVRRQDRVLLNRNHPTVKELIVVAEVDPLRAHILLDILLATDPELAKGSDPRQVEWDLLSRAELVLRNSDRD